MKIAKSPPASNGLFLVLFCSCTSSSPEALPNGRHATIGKKGECFLNIYSVILHFTSSSLNATTVAWMRLIPMNSVYTVSTLIRANLACVKSTDTFWGRIHRRFNTFPLPPPYRSRPQGAPECLVRLATVLDLNPSCQYLICVLVVPKRKN